VKTSLKKEVSDTFAIFGLDGGVGVDFLPTLQCNLHGLKGTKPAPFQLPRTLLFEKALSLAFMNPSNHSTLCNVETCALTICVMNRMRACKGEDDGQEGDVWRERGSMGTTMGEEGRGRET